MLGFRMSLYLRCAMHVAKALPGLLQRLKAAVSVASDHLAVLVALPGHDDGWHRVLHKEDVIRGQRQRKGQPARLHAAAAVELQICTAATSLGWYADVAQHPGCSVSEMHFATLCLLIRPARPCGSADVPRMGSTQCELTIEDELSNPGVLARGGLGQLGVAGPMAHNLLGHDGPAQALRHHMLRGVPLLQVCDLHAPQPFNTLLSLTMSGHVT